MTETDAPREEVTQKLLHYEQLVTQELPQMDRLLGEYHQRHLALKARVAILERRLARLVGDEGTQTVGEVILDWAEEHEGVVVMRELLCQLRATDTFSSPDQASKTVYRTVKRLVQRGQLQKLCRGKYWRVLPALTRRADGGA